MGWQGYSRSRERRVRVCYAIRHFSAAVLTHLIRDLAPISTSSTTKPLSKNVVNGARRWKSLVLLSNCQLMYSLCECVFYSTRRGRLKDNSIFPPTVFRLFHLPFAAALGALYFFMKITFHWDSIFPATTNAIHLSYLFPLSTIPHSFPSTETLALVGKEAWIFRKLPGNL